MICKKGGFIIQRHNELRDLEAEMRNTVCHDVQIEPVLQDLSVEVLPKGASITPDARLDIHTGGFWKKHSLMFACVTLMQTLTKI